MARRLCALLVAALVLVEGAGVARAFAAMGDSIECCCGRHDSHRACRCKACPVSKRRAHAATSRLDLQRDCDGQSDPGMLVVTATPSLPPPSLFPPSLTPLFLPAVRTLPGRSLEAGRPPP